jgi:hypothetical protein
MLRVSVPTNNVVGVALLYVDSTVLSQAFFGPPEVNQQTRPTCPAKLMHKRLSCKCIASQFFIWRLKGHVLA